MDYSVVMTSGTYYSGLRTMFGALAIRLSQLGVGTTVVGTDSEELTGMWRQIEEHGCKVIHTKSAASRDWVAQSIARHCAPQTVLLGFSLKDALLFERVKSLVTPNTRVVSVVQPFSLQHRSRYWRIAYLLGAHIYSKKVDHVFAPCEIEQNKLIKAGLPLSMVSTVHLPVDDYWSSDPQREQELGDSASRAQIDSLLCRTRRPKLVFLGQFRRTKGQSTLVEMMNLLRNDQPDAMLVLAGEGPQKSSIEVLSKRLGLEDSVICPGRLRHSSIPYLLSCCDLAVIPSWVETFGYCIVEPLIYGVPVVSTMTGIAGELSHIGAIRTFVARDVLGALRGVSNYLADLETARSEAKVGREYVFSNCLAQAVARAMCSNWDSLIQ